MTGESRKYRLFRGPDVDTDNSASEETMLTNLRRCYNTQKSSWNRKIPIGELKTAIVVFIKEI